MAPSTIVAQNSLAPRSPPDWTAVFNDLRPPRGSRIFHAAASLHCRMSGNDIRRRHRRPALPLPCHASAEASRWNPMYMPIGCAVVEEMAEFILSWLHEIRKSLNYQRSKTDGGEGAGSWTMVFVTDPRVLLKGSIRSLMRFVTFMGPSHDQLQSVTTTYSEHISVLEETESDLCLLVAEIYTQASKLKHMLMGNYDVSVQSSFLIWNAVFSPLVLKMLGTSTLPLPICELGSEEWAGSSRKALSLMYMNMQTLNEAIAAKIWLHKKPNHMCRFWFPYACGAIGLGVCSLWLLQHEKLKSMTAISEFWDARLKKPMFSIRNALHEKAGGLSEAEVEYQHTKEIVDRMALDLFKRLNKRNRQFDGCSDEELLQFATSNFADLAVPPAWHNILSKAGWISGISVQLYKERLDIQGLLMKVHKKMEDNELNFAMLEAMPGVALLGVVSLLLVTCCRPVIHRLFKKRDSISKQSRLLTKVGRKIEEMAEEGLLPELGMILCGLDRLFRVAGSYRVRSNTWKKIREDIFTLSDPSKSREQRLKALGLVQSEYDDLLPGSSS